MSLPTVRTAAKNYGHIERTRVNRHAQQCCMMYDTMKLPILMSICPPVRPPEDLVKLVPTGLSRSWAFTEVRSPEDVVERLRQERNHTSSQGRYPPSRGAIYSTKGHLFLAEQTLKRVSKMREVPRYRKGDSWDASEVKFVD